MPHANCVHCGVYAAADRLGSCADCNDKAKMERWAEEAVRLKKKNAALREKLAAAEAREAALMKRLKTIGEALDGQKGQYDDLYDEYEVLEARVQTVAAQQRETFRLLLKPLSDAVFFWKQTGEQPGADEFARIVDAWQAALSAPLVEGFDLRQLVERVRDTVTRWERHGRPSAYGIDELAEALKEVPK